MPRIEIKKIDLKGFIKKLPLILAQRAFLIFILFVIFVVVLGGSLAYFYIFKIQKEEVKIEPTNLRVRQEIFDEFLNNFQKREEIFNKSLEENYVDIFFR